MIVKFSKLPLQKIKLIRYNLPRNKRINLADIPCLPYPGRTRKKTLLHYKGTPFIFRLGPLKGWDTFFKGYIIYHPAAIVRSNFSFKDKAANKIKKKRFYVIKINPKLMPKCLQDVAFVHELTEMYYIRKGEMARRGRMAAGEPHKKAIIKEKKYAKRFLSSSEKKIYQQFRKTRRLFKKVFIDCKGDLKLDRDFLFFRIEKQRYFDKSQGPLSCREIRDLLDKRLFKVWQELVNFIGKDYCLESKQIFYPGQGWGLDFFRNREHFCYLFPGNPGKRKFTILIVLNKKERKAVQKYLKPLTTPTKYRLTIRPNRAQDNNKLVLPIYHKKEIKDIKRLLEIKKKERER